MTLADVAATRMANQRIAPPRDTAPEAIVSWFGAVQAQDFSAATWALALRLRRRVTHADIASAIDAGHILRTHVMRPTWHFVPAADIRWMLALTADRVNAALRWGHGQFGLDLALRRRARQVIERALASEGSLTRPELAHRLSRANIALKGPALALVVIHAELEAVICSGPRRGHQSTYALLDLRAPHAKTLARDEALAELTMRYFRSHGPATVRDFTWWSGLTAADARRGLDIIKAHPESIDGLTYWRLPTRRPRSAQRVHLLPVYDEYLVAYRDLAAVPRGASKWGVLPQAVVVDGGVVGAWSVERRRAEIVVNVRSDRRLTRTENDELRRIIDRYRAFHASSSHA